ncbi:MAG: hypothetical protein IAE85_06500 [Anaerolinea sp.]|nr:hypothetical protein [Anaerolinea sp.]
MPDDITQLESQLNDFDPAVRATALAALLEAERRGEVTPAPPADVANMHCHTFFSFNAYGYSPSGLAWLAHKNGYRLLGMVDFDVLDAVDEFLDACELVGVRGSAGIETRVFIPEFATREINSPGEPGIYYHMGIGFAGGWVSPAAAGILHDLRTRARQRNLEIVRRVNAWLDPVAVDYEQDVLPLTPAGNATERHLVLAYARAAERELGGTEGNSEELAAFWAGKLGLDAAQVTALLAEPARFQNTARAKLMKRGGVGYVQPSHDAFPRVEDFHRLITACGALPCAAWLDGVSAGEQAMEELLGLLIDQGVVALNIIPDRNWNLADPEERRRKVQHLYDVVRLAGALDLPLNVGTEMNSPGNKLMDDFDAGELAPVRQAFLDGAHFIYGHTAMQRANGLGYQSAWAQTHLPSRGQRNDFYTQIGYLVPPGPAGIAMLRELDHNADPEEFRRRVEK